MLPKIERVTECVSLGDGPHWDAATQSLFYVDVLSKHVHKYTPATNSHSKAVVGSQQPAFIIPVEDHPDHFVVSLAKELHVVRWDGFKNRVEDEEKLCQVEDGKEVFHNRFNHAKCDPSGRLWAGTMNTIDEGPLVYPPKGALYSLDSSNNNIATHLEKCRISTGLAFNEISKKMYYIDSARGTIDQYDFDIETGRIDNPKVVFTLSKNNIAGIADGMTIDSEGNLWVAVFNGGKVIKIDPTKPETLLDVINMPVKQITSVAFGGRNLDQLYVTTGAFKIDDEELPPPANGAVYRISGIGTRGRPVPNFKWKTST